MLAKTVLVIASDPQEAQKLIDVFRRNNVPFEIDVVRDKAEAMEYVFRIGKYADRSKNETPSLILLDLHPDRTRLVGLLKPLHFYLRTVGIPIVILTSSESQESEIAAFQLGAVGFVRKPFDFVSLLKAFPTDGIGSRVHQNPAPDSGKLRDGR